MPEKQGLGRKCVFFSQTNPEFSEWPSSYTTNASIKKAKAKPVFVRDCIEYNVMSKCLLFPVGFSLFLCMQLNESIKDYERKDK